MKWIQIYFVMTTAFFWLPSQGISGAYPIYREDLHLQLASLICSPKTNQPKDILSQIDLIDTQTNLHIFQRKDKKSAQANQVRTLTIESAKSSFHFGYAYGVCPNGTGWGISTPSPKSLVRKQQQVVLPTKDIQYLCHRFTKDYLIEQSILVQKDIKNQQTVSIDSKQVYSFTCQPKFPSWSGPVLWVLFNKNLNPLPHKQLFDDTKHKEDRLLVWINKIRADAKLKPVMLEPSTIKASMTLAKTQSILHNKGDVNKLKAQLKQEKLQFLGENRAQEHSLEQIASLLWLSPSHRSLLLHPKADYIGITSLKKNEEIFITLVITSQSK